MKTGLLEQLRMTMRMGLCPSAAVAIVGAAAMLFRRWRKSVVPLSSLRLPFLRKTEMTSGEATMAQWVNVSTHVFVGMDEVSALMPRHAAQYGSGW